MLFNIPDIHGPDLLLEMGLVRHLLALTWGTTFRLRHSVELAIEGEQSSTRGLREMDTDLLQSRTDAIRAQFRIFHDQLAHLVDFPQTRFAGVVLRRIIKPPMALGGPAFEDFIDAMSGRLQIGADCRDRPPFGVQIDNGSPSLIGIGDLGIGRIAPPSHRWSAAISQDPLNHVVGEMSAKMQEANGRDFPVAKARIFRLQVDDQLTHIFRQAPTWRKRFSALFAKQACHALLLKELSLVVECTLTGPSFFGT